MLEMCDNRGYDILKDGLILFQRSWVCVTDYKIIEYGAKYRAQLGEDGDAFAVSGPPPVIPSASAIPSSSTRARLVPPPSTLPDDLLESEQGSSAGAGGAAGGASGGGAGRRAGASQRSVRHTHVDENGVRTRFGLESKLFDACNQQ